MIEHEIRDKEAAAGQQVPPPFLSFKDAVVRRQGRDILTIDNLHIRQRERLALLGPNGSGKSTFVKLITREMFPLHRDVPPVLFKGRERATLAEVKACLGIVSSTMQDEITVHLPCIDIVAGGVYGSLGIPLRATGVQRARDRASDALEMLGIADVARRDVMTLSTGQARRVLIARAFVNDPETLIFDEPCTGLDPEGMYYVRSSMRKLAQAGKGIVLVTHYPEDIIPEIDRIILLKEGRVFGDGEKSRILADKTMSALFDVPMRVKRTVVCEQQKGTHFSLKAGASVVVAGEIKAETKEISKTAYEAEYFSLVSEY
ncbi:ABC transporter ATP-binding protein [Adlercreutzia sp. ZJ141]|uniref:ABC transporter ATP-binding protein n=1 Tax=Adlercreutzia sp. ZJ141 TaxID=2709406 RepID=UPI0013EAB4A8|nr:ATP-binding cassette domain-containing protein [Adlercreutzia sp. ZJ141]